MSVQDFLKRRDWVGLQTYFTYRAPETPEEFEARAMLSLSTRPDTQGAKVAAQDLQQACRMQPGNALLAANLAQALLDCGQAQAAETSVRVALQRIPFHPALFEKLALALAAQSQWDASLVETRHALTAVWPGWLAPSAALQQLNLELSIGWWKPLNVGGVQLRLVCEDDADFLAATFADSEFMRRYHRFQSTDTVAVQQWLGRALRRPMQTRRCEWLILDRNGIARGLAGLVDIDNANRRAELVVGLIHPDPGGMQAFKAAVGVMHFAFDRFGLHKLISYVYGDNVQAQHNTLHLGLRQEGLLRQHIDCGQAYLDVYVNGLLQSDYRSDARLQRLLQRWCST